MFSWFVIVLTGRLPVGLANFQAMFLRYTLRRATYFGFLRGVLALQLHATPANPGDDPRVGASVVPELEGRNRLTVAFRLILAILHIIVLALLGSPCSSSV